MTNQYQGQYLGRQFGNYRLVKLLGEGGFAEVYLGEHVHLGIQAAVKVLTTKLTDEDIALFRNEASIMMRLEHSNILQVLDFGIEGHIPYIIMRYAPKGSLCRLHSRGTRLPLQTMLGYVKQVAAALQYVHDQKLIHRDVKPENMLLGRNNEILLSDFGIVTVAHSTGSLNIQNQAGTIYYMAPEQFQGKPRPASDQYSLAVVVYEWLCGTFPFRGDAVQLMYQHLHAHPPPLRERNPTIPAEVERVIMKALEKEPQKRFESVQEFARALEQACQKPASPKVPLGTTFYTYQGHSDWISAVAWSRDGKQIASGSWDKTVQVWDATTGKRVYTYSGHSDGVATAVTWSPDGKQIASGSDDNTVQVWDAAYGDTIYTYQGHPTSVRAVAWSPDGRRIASGSTDKTVQIWDATTGGNVTTYSGHSEGVAAVAWSPDGKYIASGSWDDSVQVWDASTGRKVYTYHGHSGDMDAVIWSPDSKRIASASDDETVRVWDGTTGGNVYIDRGHSIRVLALTWSPDGKYIASAAMDKTVRVWEALTGEDVYTYRGHTDGVSAVAWSPDGARIASGSQDTTVRVWQAV